MRKVYFIISFICLATVCRGVHATEMPRPFALDDWQEARQKARVEHKRLFVNFYASWCAPCKWMEQTTFMEQDVIHALDSQYVSVRINIDTPEGKELMDFYNIRYLPTMLVFNQEGDVLDRAEETLSPRKLLTFLQKNGHTGSDSPTSMPVNLPPVLQGKGDILQKIQPWTGDTASMTAVYRLQVGVFTNYDGAADFVQQLRTTFPHPVLVTTEVTGETTRFKVFLGQFLRREEADACKSDLLENHRMSSMIRTIP